MNIKKAIYRFAREFGLDLKNTLLAFKNIGPYYSDLSKIKGQLNNEWKIESLFPCLHDKEVEAGVSKGHYFHQDLLVAQNIFRNKQIYRKTINIYGDNF